MKAIDGNLKKELLARLPHNWVILVETARAEDYDHVVLTLDAFVGRPDRMLKALRYAEMCGVAVLVQPRAQ